MVEKLPVNWCRFFFIHSRCIVRIHSAIHFLYAGLCWPVQLLSSLHQKSARYYSYIHASRKTCSRTLWWATSPFSSGWILILQPVNNIQYIHSLKCIQFYVYVNIYICMYIYIHPLYKWVHIIIYRYHSIAHTHTMYPPVSHHWFPAGSYHWGIRRLRSVAWQLGFGPGWWLEHFY
jgi:hypothetical protein